VYKPYDYLRHIKTAVIALWGYLGKLVLNSLKSAEHRGPVGAVLGVAVPLAPGLVEEGHGAFVRFSDGIDKVDDRGQEIVVDGLEAKAGALTLALKNDNIPVTTAPDGTDGGASSVAGEGLPSLHGGPISLGRGRETGTGREAGDYGRQVANVNVAVSNKEDVLVCAGMLRGAGGGESSLPVRAGRGQRAVRLVGGAVGRAVAEGNVALEVQPVAEAINLDGQTSCVQ
jgi:hypothetical protein